MGGAIFLYSFICYGSVEKVELLIKFPTRERTEKFFKYLDQYYKLLSNRHSYHFLITCDSNDASMNNVTVKKKFKKYENLTVIYGESESKIHACNRDMEKAPEFDVVMLACDDMWPHTQDYDEVILTDMNLYFSSLDGVLNYADGHPKGSHVLNTYPVIGKAYFNMCKCIYPIEYRSYFCDVELAIVSRLQGKEAILDTQILIHKNLVFTNEIDALFIRNHKPYWADQDILVKRLENNFDLGALPKRDLKYLHFCKRKLTEEQ